MAYPWPATASELQTPRTQKIQPIAFLGCREATRAPTIANDSATSMNQTSKTRGSWETVLGAPRFKDLKTALTTAEASESAQRDQASREAARRLIVSPRNPPRAPTGRTTLPTSTTRADREGGRSSTFTPRFSTVF